MILAVNDLSVGIIPARAGFTSVGSIIISQMTDHPRSRGVYSCAQKRRMAGDGSSPLARGLRSHLDAGAVNAGIIPARAGFTVEEKANRADSKDHPRSRGVYATHEFSAAVGRGSSPLARGLR